MGLGEVLSVGSKLRCFIQVPGLMSPGEQWVERLFLALLSQRSEGLPLMSLDCYGCLEFLGDRFIPH